MVTVRFYGGLGNQLFQLAAAREVGLRLNVAVSADTSWFRRPRPTDGSEPNRDYLLPSLGLAPPEDELGAVHSVHLPFWRKPWLGLAKNSAPRILRNPRNESCPDFFRATGRLYLDAFWQGEAFFPTFKPILAQALGALSPAETDAHWTSAVRAPGTVAIHVRRGDYAARATSGGEHRLLPTEYYARALAALRTKIAVSRLVVFSDDLNWCRQHLPALGVPLLFVERTQPDEATVADLLCLAQASALVIANSTFSWWAAWIASHRGARVIAPAQWFSTPSHSTWNEMLVVPGWQRL